MLVQVGSSTNKLRRVNHLVKGEKHFENNWQEFLSFSAWNLFLQSIIERISISEGKSRLKNVIHHTSSSVRARAMYGTRFPFSQPASLIG